VTHFDDWEVEQVAQRIGAAEPSTMQQLVHDLDRLFNRMTFRYERTWQCRTQTWERRLHAAMQTWRLLEENRSFVKANGRQYYGTYEALVQEVYRYCDLMVAYLFRPPAELNRLKALIGNDELFLSQLPQKIRFNDVEAEPDLKLVDEPRRLAIQHMDALLKAFAPSKFDVFLSYTGRDKPAVRQLKEHLVKFPLKVWLDQDELRPGVPWQNLLEDGIKNSSSVAVVIGSDGEGPWQREEMQGALQLAVKDKRPVIPVLLPGAPSTEPELPMFLGNRTWVDLRQGITPKGIGDLVWGITGNKPDVQ
jgi:hypothetical protein